MAYLDWSNKKIESFRKTLLDWYDQQGRDLPWRRDKDPYHIWVSEIMLQQTQVETVIPYYERFIKELPTIKALAECPEDQLLRLWQGLGYYSRVRNMQLAAKQIQEDFDGVMPDNRSDLEKLKGIGPYTAAAIASIAFDQVEPAIDGNLLRVTARLFEIEEDISQPKNRKVFKEILDQLIDPQRPGDFNQAMMDIGATIMTPSNYDAHESPIKAFDQSYQRGTAALYPVKKPKKKAQSQEWLAYYIVDRSGNVLIRQHQADELLAGLWHFPLIKAAHAETIKSEGLVASTFLNHFTQVDQIAEQDREDLSRDFEVYFNSDLPMVKHVFSHRIWQVKCLGMVYQGRPQDLLDQLHLQDSSFTWLTVDQLTSYPFSSLQKKIMKRIKESDLLKDEGAGRGMDEKKSFDP